MIDRLVWSIWSDIIQLPYTSKLEVKTQSDNLQIPCVQPPTSSYNLQLAMVIMDARVMVVVEVVVNMVDRM